MDKPANPTTLDDAGKALLATLPEPQLLFDFDFNADWYAEPLALPAEYYVMEPSPSGLSVMGWRLTSAGIVAWHSVVQSAA